MLDIDVTTPRDAGFDGEAIEDAWLTLVRAADRHEYGGAVALVARHGRIALHRATGWAVREPEDRRSPMGVDTIFDLASLTKVTATLPSTLRLVADGRFSLDTPVRDLLPVVAEAGLSDAITVRHLLAHCAGLIDWLPVFLREAGEEAYLRAIAEEGVQGPPGERVVYSDPGFITLGAIVRAVSGQGVDAFARQHVFGPLGMDDTMFMPPASRRLRAAGTEHGNAFEAARRPGERPASGPWRTELLRGEVHDGNAWYGLGGVAGHAGLFGTAIDLYRYGMMWMNGGSPGESPGDPRILPEGLVAEATREQIVDHGERRALGWRMVPADGGGEDEAGRGMGPNAFGHTGFTGTSLWMDPDTGVLIVLLTNRVHPTVSADYLTTRSAFTMRVMEAVR